MVALISEVHSIFYKDKKFFSMLDVLDHFMIFHDSSAFRFVLISRVTFCKYLRNYMQIYTLPDILLGYF